MKQREIELVDPNNFNNLSLPDKKFAVEELYENLRAKRPRMPRKGEAYDVLSRRASMKLLGIPFDLTLFGLYVALLWNISDRFVADISPFVADISPVVFSYTGISTEVISVAFGLSLVMLNARVLISSAVAMFIPNENTFGSFVATRLFNGKKLKKLQSNFNAVDKLQVLSHKQDIAEYNEKIEAIKTLGLAVANECNIDNDDSAMSYHRGKFRIIESDPKMITVVR